MSKRINPFHELYLAEAVGSKAFVKLFSPLFVDHGAALFQPGNVILKGLQGSGKTMLLNLLKPEIRIAYKQEGVEFPVPKMFRKFISAGINLRKSGVAEFSQLILPNSSPSFTRELALSFGDFVNYWVVYDLLKTIKKFSEEECVEIRESIGLDCSDSTLDKFAAELSSDKCWHGGITRTESFADLQKQISQRILTYRNYLNLNIESLPEAVQTTKTVIGEPISVSAESLRKFGVLEKDASVFIRIDQYEELPTLDFSSSKFGTSCQQLIHKALSSRTGRVSYRIGTRQHAWPDTPIIFSTTGMLEMQRDYSVINIDEKLRRGENRRTWIFPDLVEDVFQRRLKLINYEIGRRKKSLLLEVFGKTLSASEKAKLLVSSAASRQAVIAYNSDWPSAWISFLKNLATTDPLSAKLAEAWVSQKSPKKHEAVYVDHTMDSLPWNRPYWKKERAEQALTQIASRNKQQPIWQGQNDIIGLSGGNILVFLFICQQIWDAWLRDSRGVETVEPCKLPCISDSVQSMGILYASEEWLRKALEGRKSKTRLQFIHYLGARYYNLLTNDLAMSYPGRNGFSVASKALEDNEELRSFLSISVDYGDLYDAPHTSKSKGEKRRKFYLAPILCPAFKIPFKHTKEPEYLAVDSLSNVIHDFDRARKNSNRKLLEEPRKNADRQQSLFD